MTKILQNCLAVFSLIALNTLLQVNTANAQVRAYTKQQYNQTNAGGFFQSVNGQTDLRMPLPDTGKIFTGKIMWLLDGAGNWVETGSIKGYTSPDGISTPTYWAGEYYGRQKVVNNVTTYLRRLIGSSGSTGPKSFQVIVGQANGSSYNWDFYVNNTYIGSFDSPKNTFPYMQVGMETNNGCGNFVSGTYSDSLYIYTPTKTWQSWGANVVASPPDSRVIWSSSYSQANQKVTFTSGINAGCSY
jgi:hypothetical protein